MDTMGPIKSFKIMENLYSTAFLCFSMGMKAVAVVEATLQSFCWRRLLA